MCAIVYSQRILVNIQVPIRPASQQQQQMAAFGVKWSLYYREKKKKAKTNRYWRTAMSNLFPLTSTSLHNSNNHFSDKEKQAPQFSFKSRNLGGDFWLWNQPHGSWWVFSLRPDPKDEMSCTLALFSCAALAQSLNTSHCFSSYIHTLKKKKKKKLFKRNAERLNSSALWNELAVLSTRIFTAKWGLLLGSINATGSSTDRLVSTFRQAGVLEHAFGWAV